MTLYDCASPYVNIWNNCPLKAYKRDTGCKTTIKIQVTLIFVFPCFAITYLQNTLSTRNWTSCDHMHYTSGLTRGTPGLTPLICQSLIALILTAFVHIITHLICCFGILKQSQRSPVLPQTGWNYPQFITFLPMCP